MAEEAKKNDASTSGTTTSNSGSTTKSASTEATAGSNKNALVYSQEQIDAMVAKQDAATKRSAAIEKAGFDISDDELPENVKVTVETSTSAISEQVLKALNLDPAQFGVVQKTEGLDISIPGGKYVVVRGNRAYYVNANGEEITEDGKLINPRPEVNMVNMATPAR